MRTATASSRRFRLGYVRLLPAASLALGALGLSLARHPAPAPAHPTAPVAASDGCGCGPATGSVSYRRDSSKKIFLADSEEGKTTAAPSDAAKAAEEQDTFYTLIVAPGQTIPLATSRPLPIGDGEQDGRWSAIFGKISKDGKRYTAPKFIPPGGMEAVEYFNPSALAPLSKTIPFHLVLNISIRGSGPSSDNEKISPCKKVFTLPLVNIEQGSDQITQTSPSSKDSSLLHLAKLGSDANAKVGYVLPSWGEGNGDVILYMPQSDPETGRVIAHAQVCKKNPVSTGSLPTPDPKWQTGYVITVATPPGYYIADLNSPLLGIGNWYSKSNGFTTKIIAQTSYTLSAQAAGEIADQIKPKSLASVGFNANGTINFGGTTNLPPLTETIKAFTAQRFVSYYYLTPAKTWKWMRTDSESQSGHVYSYKYQIGNSLYLEMAGFQRRPF